MVNNATSDQGPPESSEKDPIDAVQLAYFYTECWQFYNDIRLRLNLFGIKPAPCLRTASCSPRVACKISLQNRFPGACVHCCAC